MTCGAEPRVMRTSRCVQVLRAPLRSRVAVRACRWGAPIGGPPDDRNSEWCRQHGRHREAHVNPIQMWAAMSCARRHRSPCFPCTTAPLPAHSQCSVPHPSGCLVCACCRWVAKLRSYMAFQASKKAPSVAVKLTDLYNLETMRTVLWPLQKHFRNVLPGGKISYPPWRTLESYKQSAAAEPRAATPRTPAEPAATAWQLESTCRVGQVRARAWACVQHRPATEPSQRQRRGKVSTCR